MAKDTSTAKPKEKKKRGRVFKETFSELKKVTWPSFGTVVKQTGIVLGVVVLFLAALMLFDWLLGWLYDLLVTGLNAGTETTASAFMGLASKSFTSGVGLPLCL